MSNKRSCQKYDRMVDDYIDGFLSEKDAEKLEAHLAECEDCRASLRFSIALRNMTRASAESIPQEVHDKIISQANACGRRKQMIRRGALSVACALIFVASVAVWAMLPGRQKSEDLPPDNDPIVQITDENTKISLSKDPLEEPETDSTYPMPEVQGPAENTHSSNEYQTPEGPAVESEAEKNEEDLIPETAQAEASQKADESEIITETHPQTDASPDAEPPVAESLGDASPGGDDITLALLIVSGLLAVASFIAFLISLSSVRQIPSKKDKE